MNCTEKIYAEFESFDSFFAGLSMRKEKNAMILYEKYIQSFLTSKISQALDDLLSFLDKPLSATPKQKNQ